MIQVLVLLLAIGIANLLFVTLQVVVLKVARLPVDQIGIGLPPVFKGRVQGVEFKIGPLPFLAFVYSAPWKEAPRSTRVLTVLAPWVVLSCIPFVFMKPARALKTELWMWPRLIEGALDSERAHAFLGALSNLLEADRIEAVCVVLAFMAAMNLAPIPGVAGGHVMTTLLGLRPEDRTFRVLGAIAITLWGLILASWLLKLLTFVVS